MEDTSPPAYFLSTGIGFQPTEAAASPWEDDKLSGVSIGGLLAHVIAREIEGSGMNVARLVIDILGAAPRVETLVTHRIVRAGQRLKVIEAQISDGERVAARATAMLIRNLRTPCTLEPLKHPLPEDVAASPPSTRRALVHANERRVVYGNPREPVPGAMWFRSLIPIVDDVPTAPLVRAAMLGDMGSAIGSTLSVRDYTFANTDITIQFLRMPVGDWQLIDAATETAGNGHAVVSSVFSDRNGVYMPAGTKPCSSTRAGVPDAPQLTE